MRYILAIRFEKNKDSTPNPSHKDIAWSDQSLFIVLSIYIFSQFQRQVLVRNPYMYFLSFQYQFLIL